VALFRGFYKIFGTDLTSGDFIAYFDETLFGSGDTGVGCTYDRLISNVWQSNFVILFSDMEQIACTGKLNKTLSILAKNDIKYSIELTQGNSGAIMLTSFLQEVINKAH
jgi:hypothetical protein